MKAPPSPPIFALALPCRLMPPGRVPFLYIKFPIEIRSLPGEFFHRYQLPDFIAASNAPHPETRAITGYYGHRREIIFLFFFYCAARTPVLIFRASLRKFALRFREQTESKSEFEGIHRSKNVCLFSTVVQNPVEIVLSLTKA